MGIADGILVGQKLGIGDGRRVLNAPSLIGASVGVEEGLEVGCEVGEVG